jgi:hypothetical protein
MRVEQRIGRIDRFGQEQSQVYVVSFFVDGTIDTRILQRLYERILVFEQSIGELEPILGPEIAKLQVDAFHGGFSEEELEKRANDALLRIENLRRETEEFEAARAELMGQGDLLRQEVESLQASGRYVSPEEISALLKNWLRHRKQNGDRLDRVQPKGPGLKEERDRVYDLRLSPSTIGRVQRWMTEHRVNHPEAQRLLFRLQTEHHAWCTFDNQVARRYDRMPFLHLGHPVVSAALEDLKASQLGSWTSRIATLVLRAGLHVRKSIEDTLLVLYRVGVHAAEPQDSLLAVAVDLETRSVRDGLGDDLLGSLAECHDADFVLDDSVLAAERIAYEYAEQRRREVERLAIEQQASRVAVRSAALERTYRARIQRKREISAKVTDPRIIRLYEGQVANLEARLRDELDVFAHLPEPSAELEVLAAAVFIPGVRSVK